MGSGHPGTRLCRGSSAALCLAALLMMMPAGLGAAIEAETDEDPEKLADDILKSLQIETCHTNCTKACAEEHERTKKHPICDLPHNATSYDETPKKHSDGEVKLQCVGTHCTMLPWAKGAKEKKRNEKRVRMRMDRCKTQVSVDIPLVVTEKRSQRNHKTCTSCKSDFIFVPRDPKSRTGQCGVMTEKESVKCFPLDRDYQDSGMRYDPIEDKNVICTKWVLTAAYFYTQNFNKDSHAYKHFEKARGHQGDSVVRCMVTKHSACREGNCAVKKSVQCHSVCKRKRGDWVKTENGEEQPMPGETKDCDYGKNLCEGNYTDAAGETQYFGALACQNVAMMA